MNEDKIMYIAFLGYASMCLLGCFVATIDLIKTEPLRPIGSLVAAIILIILFIKQLYISFKIK